jgi:PAS domain S-box-containing protein
MTDINPGSDELKKTLEQMQSRMDVLTTVLDESTDPIFNILEDGTYRYVNSAFAGPFGKQPEDIIGKKIYDIFSVEEAAKRMSVVKKAFASGETIVFDVRVPHEPEDLFFITSVKPVKDENGTITSVICISKNITDRKRVEQEREKLISDLQTAFSKIRTLSGLFSICSNCKKIRSDQGSWTQIELYIRDHSDADFSHGICPDCAHKLYPGIDVAKHNKHDEK